MTSDSKPSELREFRNSALWVLGFIAVLLAATWMIQGNSFFLYRYFAPRQEAVRREVFEETKSYRQGMVQELQNMQFQYVKADSAYKSALADIILRRAADFDAANLPPDLRSFIATLRQSRTGR